jgi:hypothetical protein
VHVEYDMPIRKGVPAKFDVTVTNIRLGEVILQRFSLTREYGHDYRRADRTLQAEKVAELAALDLGEAVLARGETKTFSLSVTFPKAGRQRWYVNAMVLGPSQAWDNMQGYTFDIRE